ncbi:hypothetical protein IAQ61_010624 [Plenodomus lingam]|uniref:dihydroneopterin aldolase n=1 Tax=Leptosphaeria maculans (strain JN3 / isolate v23.1.3 / race Av1-4-5-6-7-8) TaxID=985895 RepID=E4ZIZ7_LEPMJ|nr:hypothetical protein LEMA_P067750.1 [Plenodomus lingam JN3]KAH9860889.1 hypothetical protein IAQ61_010624 [Plenodomus lingam]CBX91267.1 hypothetical protein LEMA_P067750.1 [Plenodomus lingam JN3]
MAQLVRQAHWDAQVAVSDYHDKIAVQNLEVVVHAGKDVWGRPKKQRAQVSVTLTLGSHFASAAATDSVDHSTVHYGLLSKAIQAELADTASEWMSTAALSARILQSVCEVAGSTVLYAIETDVCYPKGSMLGDGAGHITSTIQDGPSQATTLHSSVLYLRNVRIPCVIGVNANERLQKQPVVLNVWIDRIPDSRVDDYTELETLLIELVSETSFQTIESLLAWLMDELRQKFFTRDEYQEAWVRLRIAKPLAVPFAEAPAVEIVRPVRSR